MVLLTSTLLGQSLSAPPYVTQDGVVNAASRIPVALPGGALAPGALVEIDGLRFTPSDLKVEIATAHRTYSAAIVQATPEHILVKLPNFTERGAARLYVRSRGQRSSGSDIILGSAAFGIFTVNGKGWGAARALPILHPGDEVSLAGTGLGHASTSNIQVFVGGRKAAPVRRSASGGGSQQEDRLRFVLPSDVPQGCAVPVTVSTHEVNRNVATSNVATIAIASGAQCAWSPAWLNRGGAGKKSGTVLLLRSDLILELAPGKPVHFLVDAMTAGFAERLKDDLPALFDLMPPAGACMSFAGHLNDNDLVLPSLIQQSLGGDEMDVPGLTENGFVKDLDAGSELTITGKAGTRSAIRSTHPPLLYTKLLGGDPPFSHITPTPPFLIPGPYRIEFPGGANVGAASAQVEVPAEAVWTNRDAMTALDRREGAAPEWTLPPNYQAVVIVSNIDRRKSLAGYTLCAAPPGATRLHVPPSALANLPATRVGGSDLSLGFMGIAAIPMNPATLDAKGLDSGLAIFVSLSGRSVVIK